MPSERLSPLDASFLAVESPVAHMHVGWAARLQPTGERPRFPELFAHVAARLEGVRRLHRRLAPVPFGVHAPEWAEDPDFDPYEHILHSPAAELGELADTVMSAPLPRDRPLWQLWIADRLADGGIGVVGKAHHCMVDGLAAVELGSLLLDLEPEPVRAHAARPTERAAAAAAVPSALALLVRAVEDRARDAAGLAGAAAGLARHPRRLAQAPHAAERAARTLAHSLRPAAPAHALNRAGSPERHLATATRPLADLREIAARWRPTTVNDVLLAACAGALRERALRAGEQPAALKAMVPVDVRGGEGAGTLGNRISFVFVELPCAEPDPVLRLLAVHRAMAERKRLGVPADADAALRALGRAPRSVQSLAAHAIADPRMYNLVVSNIPGIPVPAYLLGCRLQEAFPVVPLAERHALSVGMTTIDGLACFGLYADRATLPEADAIAAGMGTALDELRDAPASDPWRSAAATRFRRAPEPAAPFAAPAER